MGKLIGTKDINLGRINGKIKLNYCNGTTVYNAKKVYWWVGQKDGKSQKASVTFDVDKQVVTDFNCEEQ